MAPKPTANVRERAEDELDLAAREEMVDEVNEKFAEMALYHWGRNSNPDDVRDIFLASLPQAVLWRFIVEN